MQQDSSNTTSEDSLKRRKLRESLQLIRIGRMIERTSVPESVAQEFKKNWQIVGAQLAAFDQIKWSLSPSEKTNEPQAITEKKSQRLPSHTIKSGDLTPSTDNPVLTQKQPETSTGSAVAHLEGEQSTKDVDDDSDAGACDPMLTHPPQIPLTLDPSDPGLERAELSLRRLIVARSEWSEMKPHAWKIYEKWQKPEIAAKLAEISYVHGSIPEFLSVLQTLLRDGCSFYFLIQKRLRDHMVLRLWINKKESILNHFLHQKIFRSYLLPIEHLFVFWSLYGSTHPRQSYEYFKRFRSDITRSLQDSGQALKLTPSYFYFIVGRLAHEYGDRSEARRLLEKVDRNDSHFHKALDLLVEYDAETDSQGLNTFERRLSQQTHWSSRLQALEGFLVDCAKIEGVRHQERAALNQLLANPLKWFPENFDAWHELSTLLLRYFDISFLLPNITKLFDDNQLHFHTPTMDRAIWTPVTKAEFDDPFKTDFYQSIAHIHEYIASGCKDDRLLWHARALYLGCEQSGKLKLPLTWRELHRKLLSFVAKTSRFDEIERKKIISSLKVTANHTDIDASEIDSFLEINTEPPAFVLSKLQELAGKREDAQLELRLLRTQSRHNHYDNDQLARTWALARSLGDQDLAWRVASVLQGRRVLAPLVERSWSLSSEKRKDFPLKSFSAGQLSLITHDLPMEGQRFAQSILAIGPLLPELLSYLSDDVKPSKRVPGHSDFEKSLENTLKTSTLFPEPKRLYTWHTEVGSQSVPPFALSLPHNRWVQVMLHLADRLGFNAWKWKVSLLGAMVDSLFSRLQKPGGDQNLPSKAGKWLRQLTPMQRKSWYELGVTCKQLSDDQAALYTGMLLSRLSTCMLHQHTLALDSLTVMDTPLAIRWDLETFILSDEYSRLRREVRVLHHLDVAENLPEDPRILQ